MKKPKAHTPATEMRGRLCRNIETLRPKLMELAAAHGTPLYVYEPERVRQNLRTFRDGFAHENVPMSIFYAVKSNSYPGLLRTVAEEAAGLDVSSTRELALALDAGTEQIVYTGPAKRETDFAAIVANADRITVHLESARELQLLAGAATQAGKTVRCGLRVATSAHKSWAKFGQPLRELRAFYDEAASLPSLRFCGIHCHLSWNDTPKPYVQALAEIAAYLKATFSASERGSFAFLDIGGGFIPSAWQGDYPWNKDGLSNPSLEDVLPIVLKDGYQPRFESMETCRPEEFFREIARSYHETIKPLLPAVRLFAEPGRFICHDAMHMIFTIIDKKTDQMGIVDGGNNMIGWEKYQYFAYAPLFDLTHFSFEREIPFVTYGSLCTPNDLWGYYLHCSSVEEGDVIALPWQGAYTYTLAQEFIKPIPPVAHLGR